jgi:hypothetical protein
MNGWIKHFLDGQSCIGEDEQVSRGLVSWRKSRCDGMVGAALGHDNCAIEISGLGEYWQSDQYESSMGSHSSKLVARRISRLVEEGDHLEYREEKQPPYSSKPTTARASFSKVKGFALDSGYVGKWLVLEIICEPPTVRMYFSTQRS